MGQIIMVVPCYNEERRLPVERILEYAKESARVHFLLVNDGSSDRTGEVLRHLQTACPSRIRTFEMPQNRGKAEAVREGMSRALEARRPDATDESQPHDSQPPSPAEGLNDSVDFVGFWDADLATPLEEIACFVSELEANASLDMVFGARVKLLGRTIERKAHRHYFGRVLATLVSGVLEMPIYDSQCGAKLFRATPRLKSCLEQPFVAGWIFDVELLARLKQSYARDGIELSDRMLEYPLHRWRDVGGSKVHASDGLIALWNLARIKRRYLS